MGLVLLVVVAAPAVVVLTVIGLLLTRLGQICFFFVNTSQYSLVAVFQKIWTPQL